ncbi:N-acetyl-gamma-glutamyl-phosphate reductase [Dehalococcoidia bacterium]|nr:N-acetyl-gamma-glutamyl-phosphate reductase [Dehalococcoidia bacterium]
MIRAGIINVTGYAGIELARILKNHGEIDLVGVTGRSMAGQKLDEAFPFLDSMNMPILEEDALEGVDIVFSALPHKASAEACVRHLEQGSRVVDISADFRLKNVDEYEEWYQPHPAPAYLEEAVYGLTELHRKDLTDAKLVANPGCYPTGAVLGLAPLAQAGLIESDVVVDSKSGVSGAGRTLSLTVHYSEVNENVSAYGLDGHRHYPEIVQELRDASPDTQWRVTFTPHLIPMTRGILSTIYLTPKDGAFSFDESGKKRLQELYQEHYRNEPFVRVASAPPQTKQVYGSNMTLVFPTMDLRARRIVVVTVLDNLVKGAAGQAIQNMNVMYGLPENQGLEGLAIYP